MKQLLLILLLSCVGICSAQQPQSFIKYHQDCRQAEKYFINGDTAKCFDTYNQLFSEYDYLFPRDCFMAAQFAHNLGKDSLAVAYLCKAVQFGLRPDFLSTEKEHMIAIKLLDLKESKHWQKFEMKGDSLYQLYKNKVNWELKSELIKMVRVDQDWRAKNNKWFNRNLRRGMERKFISDNRKHILFLDSVCNIYGYPGSWLTGIGDSLSNETSNASLYNLNLSSLPNIILYHNDSVFNKHGEFLFSEIDKGHIHPRTYAMIRDFRDRHLVKKDKNEKMYYNIWWRRDNFSSEEFEAHCHEIGCPTKKNLRELARSLGAGYDVFWLPFR